MAFAPTSKADFHIRPKDDMTGFVEVDRFSCSRCHRDTISHARSHEFGRDWYGRIRGNSPIGPAENRAGIFSFHPFSLDSISKKGSTRGITIELRPELVEAGVVEMVR